MAIARLGVYITIVVLPFITACSQGRNFTRPDLSVDLEIGRTTEAEVTARYGQPLSRSDVSQTTTHTPFGALPKEQSTLVYGYGERGFLASDVSGRIAFFGFQNGLLRSLVFGSTFPTDQKDFDAGLAQMLLARPGLTRADLVAALGPPQGRITITGGRIERDGWYVLENHITGAKTSTVVSRKSLTADILPNGLVVAHKLDVSNAH